MLLFIKMLFIRLSFSNHTTEFTPGFFKTFFFKAVYLNLFILTSGRLFEKGQKADMFFNKILQDQSPNHILIFSTETV